MQPKYTVTREKYSDMEDTNTIRWIKARAEMFSISG